MDRELEELVEQGPYLTAIGCGFQLEDDMDTYKHVMTTDPRMKAARATADRWEGHDTGLEDFHKGESFGIWAVVAGFAILLVGMVVLRYG